MFAVKKSEDESDCHDTVGNNKKQRLVQRNSVTYKCMMISGLESALMVEA